MLFYIDCSIYVSQTKFGNIGFKHISYCWNFWSTTVFRNSSKDQYESILGWYHSICRCLLESKSFDWKCIHVHSCFGKLTFFSVCLMPQSHCPNLAPRFAPTWKSALIGAQSGWVVARSGQVGASRDEWGPAPTVLNMFKIIGTWPRFQWVGAMSELRRGRSELSRDQSGWIGAQSGLSQDKISSRHHHDSSRPSYD
jgi:hypothetical protein